MGQLDGGHIIHAILGQSQGILLGQIARVLMFLLGDDSTSYGETDFFRLGDYANFNAPSKLTRT